MEAGKECWRRRSRSRLALVVVVIAARLATTAAATAALAAGALRTLALLTTTTAATATAFIATQHLHFDWIPCSFNRGGWVYAGCFQDFVVPKSAETVGDAWAADITRDWSKIRALPHVAILEGASASPQSCINLAGAYSSNYVGMEAAKECWFGKAFNPLKFAKVADSLCEATVCAGDKASHCGDSSHLMMYRNTETTTPALTLKA
ncbi:MAG: hypothetical protein WDW38_000290 [Sanguina aurantia]